MKTDFFASNRLYITTIMENTTYFAGVITCEELERMLLGDDYEYEEYLEYIDYMQQSWD